MKTVLLYDAPVSLRGDRFKMDRTYGVEVDALAEYFEQVVVCNPVATFDIPQARYEPRATNISLEILPYFSGVTSSFPVFPGCAHKIWRASRSWDLLYIRLPSPLGIIGYLSAVARKIPVVLYVVGDLEAQYEQGRYRGLSKVAARAAVKLFEGLTRWMVKHAVVITQGEACTGSTSGTATASSISCGRLFRRNKLQIGRILAGVPVSSYCSSVRSWRKRESLCCWRP